MNTTATSTGSVAVLDSALNNQILAGDILGAFETYYADDVVMQENTAEPFVGKDFNRKREQEFVNSLEAVHGVQLLGSAVNGDLSYSEWVLDVTFKGGIRATLTQVSARRWKNGKIVHERFYYNKG